jgi:O-antigen ligase/Flp pilus assembly protein TadD
MNLKNLTKMQSNNNTKNKFNWVYLTGFFIILALPLFTFSPWMYPADFPKTIIFRSIVAILGFLFLASSLQKGTTETTNQSKKPDCCPSQFSQKLRLVLAMTKRNPIIWALLGLLGISFLAGVFSVDWYFSLWGSPWRGGGFVTYAFYFIFAILTFVIFKKPAWQKVWDFSIIVGVLVSLVGIFQYLGLFNKILVSVENRPASTTGSPILLAIYILLLFFLTLSFLIKANKIKKAFYGACLLIFSYTIFITGTRAVWAGIFIGTLYFLSFYPIKSLKTKWAKIITGLFFLIVIGLISYVNIFPSSAKTPPKNRILQTLESRLSIKSALNDERFQGWKVALMAIKDKPILGYGPENFAVGFDKNYDPKIISSFWWDKAHNTILDTGVQTGILGIIAYLALFIALFFQLQKLKHAEINAEQYADSTLIGHGVQATLIGYFVAMFFSFDSFATYLIFFLLIAYSLHLISLNNAEINAEQYANNTLKNKISISVNSALTQRLNQRNFSGKKIILTLSFLLLIFFLYQCNIKPFLINIEINKARDFANQKYCNQSLNLLEKNLTQKSFLDSYVRLSYVEFTKTCNVFYPENNLAYLKKGSELIKEAVKIQPRYTRFWLYLGSTNNALAVTTQDPQIKKDLLNQASLYLEKALQLAPKHQEIIIEQAKVAITSGKYKEAKEYAQECLDINSNYVNCYWYLALSEIYLKDINSAKESIKIATDKGYNINSKESLNNLSDAYGSIPDYENLVIVYNKLITLIDPSNAQYHSSIAFFYKQLGKYKEAREEALRVLQLSPESKPNVDEFLRTLPLK